VISEDSTNLTETTGPFLLHLAAPQDQFKIPRLNGLVGKVVGNQHISWEKPGFFAGFSMLFL
jgi:hypothetical protein